MQIKVQAKAPAQSTAQHNLIQLGAKDALMTTSTGSLLSPPDPPAAGLAVPGLCCRTPALATNAKACLAIKQLHNNG